LHSVVGRYAICVPDGGLKKFLLHSLSLIFTSVAQPPCDLGDRTTGFEPVSPGYEGFPLIPIVICSSKVR
jgi:hypothetical protein